MRKVHFYLGTEFAGVKYEEIIEFPDRTTNDEIDEEYEMWANDRLDKQWWDE